MRISCCISSLSGGGAEHLMSGLAARLMQRHDVQLVTLSDAERDDYPVPDGVERYPLGLQRDSLGRFDALHSNVERIQGVRDALQKFEPDVVLSFSDQMNVVSVFAARRLKVPIVVTELTDPRHHPLPKIWHWLRRWAYPRANAAVAVSDAAAAAIRPLCRFPVHTIRPAVEKPPEIPLAATGCGSGKRLVTVGRLSPEKRFDLLIRAFAKVAPRHPDWSLEIAGSGPREQALQAAIERTGLEQRIRLCGRIPSVWPFLSQSHAYALTSRYEGTPVALMEAMAVGLPCLAIDCDCGAGEILEHGTDGILTPDNETAFTEQLDRFLGDEALRERIGSAAVQTVQQFSWESFVGQFEDLLQSTAADFGSRRKAVRRRDGK